MQQLDRMCPGVAVKCLVIGGCGFAGSHIVDRCLEAGFSVRVLGPRPEAWRAPIAGVDYVCADMSNDEQLSAALAGIDAVIHVASTSVPASSAIDPVADVTGNLVPLIRLLHAMRLRDVRRIVFLSSGGTVYGVPVLDPIPEDHPTRPITPYGITKLAMEHHLSMETRLGGVQSVVLRASNLYGPRHGHTGIQGVIGTYLWHVVRGEPIEIWGDGTVVRDFLHIRDLADLCMLCLASERSGCFNAGCGRGHSMTEIVDTIRRVTGQSINPVFKPGRSFDVPRAVLDTSLAEKTFGWRACVPLEDGISETWAWVRSMRKLGHNGQLHRKNTNAAVGWARAPAANPGRTT